MKRKKRSFFELLLSFLSLGILIYLIINFPPNFQIKYLNLSLPLLALFIILLFTFLFLLFKVLFVSKRRGFLIALFVNCYFLLKINNLGNPFFIILLIGLFGGAELFFVKRK